MSVKDTQRELAYRASNPRHATFKERVFAAGTIQPFEMENLMQYDRGQKVEREHAPTIAELRAKTGCKLGMEDEEIFRSIARDHVLEIPFYYTYLDGMETMAKQHIEQCKDKCDTDVVGTCVKRCVFEKAVHFSDEPERNILHRFRSEERGRLVQETENLPLAEQVRMMEKETPWVTEGAERPYRVKELETVHLTAVMKPWPLQTPDELHEQAEQEYNETLENLAKAGHFKSVDALLDKHPELRRNQEYLPMEVPPLHPGFLQGGAQQAEYDRLKREMARKKKFIPAPLSEEGQERMREYQASEAKGKRK